MSSTLQIDYAVRSEAGNKTDNGDACDARVPGDRQLLNKGVTACVADGVSASEGGREAAQVCVRGFLTDYYSTPESWTVKTATGQVLGALNGWLCGQGQQRYDSPSAMITTFSALVIKSSTAHIVHVGDSRIWLYRGGNLEQLTRDHRVWLSAEREFLVRAMGADPHIEIDYRCLAAEPGDLFVFTTDGVHDYLTRKELREVLGRDGCHLQACANAVVDTALQHGSQDNVSCQLLRVISLPEENEGDLYQRITELPFPPSLQLGMKIDGYEILRELHAGKRSEVFLALDTESGDKVVLKTPSENYRDDPEFLDAFLHEEWVGRRAHNAHLLRVLEPRRRRFLYNIAEYVEGESLAQWMKDHGQASLEQARGFAAQVIEGLRVLHRLEMVHQDLKPDNVLIDSHGTLRLIDFGSMRIAGMGEIDSRLDRALPQGTLNYAAPECLQGKTGTRQSDMYSLGVIVYELLTGALPYGETDRPAPRRYHKYTPARLHAPGIPSWVDGALAKAVNPDPRRRYQALSEFQHDLKHPNPAFADTARLPLMERNPLAFWRGLAGLLFIIDLILLVLLV
ncbi:MAG: bifunctional protein-serine/threonine kinase/phosphatase [Pseudomonadota bacterium]